MVNPRSGASRCRGVLNRHNASASIVVKMHGTPCSDHKTYWTRLLPGARRSLVDAGYFTPEGDITDAGRMVLKLLMECGEG